MLQKTLQNTKLNQQLEKVLTRIQQNVKNRYASVTEFRFFCPKKKCPGQSWQMSGHVQHEVCQCKLWGPACTQIKNTCKMELLRKLLFRSHFNSGYSTIGHCSVKIMLNLNLHLKSNLWLCTCAQENTSFVINSASYLYTTLII